MLKTTQISSAFTISYREEGEQGIPLVFLHAFPLSSQMWQTQLEEFSKEYRVFAVDLRGVGKTSTFEGKPSIQTLAADLSTWLEEIDVYEGIVLCGLSLGGYIALEFARTYPEKLRALVLADTRADLDNSEARKARNEMIAFAKENTGSAVAQKMLPKLLGETTRKTNPRLGSKVKDIALPNVGKNLAQLFTAIRDRRDSTGSLAEIKCPTLVIGGSEDAVTTPTVMAPIVEHIPNARHVVIDGAGHLSNLEKPDAFNEALRNFLAEIK